MGRLKLFGAVLSAMQIDATGRIAIVYLDHEMARAAGGTYDDTEGLINLPLTVKEIQAVVFFKQIESEQYRVSMRSKGHIDIGAVAKEFDGGGHKNAAGCTVTGAIDTLQKLFIERIEHAIQLQEQAPVSSASHGPGDPAKAGHLLMEPPLMAGRYHCSAMDGSVVNTQFSRRRGRVRRDPGTRVGHTERSIRSRAAPLHGARTARAARAIPERRAKAKAEICLGFATTTYDRKARREPCARGSWPDRVAIETGTLGLQRRPSRSGRRRSAKKVAAVAAKDAWKDARAGELGDRCRIKSKRWNWWPMTEPPDPARRMLGGVLRARWRTTLASASTGALTQRAGANGERRLQAAPRSRSMRLTIRWRTGRRGGTHSVVADDARARGSRSPTRGVSAPSRATPAEDMDPIRRPSGRVLRLVDRNGNLVGLAEPARTPGLLHPFVVLM